MISTEDLTIIIGGVSAACTAGYATIKLIVAQWEKYQAKNGKSNKYALREHCGTLHANILDSLRDHFTTINDIVKQRTFEDGIKRKHDVILANATSFMKHKGVHDFAIRKADKFKDFIISNYTVMFESTFEVFCEKIMVLADSVKREGMQIAEESYVNYFYDNYHMGSIEDYLKDVRLVFKDIVNNKPERFIDESMRFEQRFLSDMANAYVEWVKQSFEEKQW